MKLFTQFKLFFPIFFISLMICTSETFAQPSTANYAFTHAANGSLTDMTGATDVIGASNSIGTSGLRDIGFDFIFMGNLHTKFGVSVRGVLRLGGNPSSSGVNNLNTTTASLLPIITPFWDAIGTSADGSVRYKVTGSAPNRVLTVEWFNMRIAPTGSITADGTFQLRLYETTGKVEFVYGSMNIGTGSPVVTASIGFTTGNADNSLLSVTDISTPTVTTLSGSVVNNLVNSSTPGPIAGLNSINENERVIYTFTPPAVIPNAPTNLSFTNVMDNSVTLNWIDNASNESGYAVENVNDGIITSLPANSTFFEATNLSLQTNYTWRVYALTEGVASTALEGSQATTNVNNLPTTASYIFTHAANGSLTDMSTGAQELIGPNNTPATSGIRDIGFNFIFMGQMYTQFGVSGHGVLRLGGNPTADGNNNLNTTTAGLLPLITPFWDNIGTSSTGAVRYKVTGSAPNRVMTVEWLNMNIALTSSTSPDGTFQLRLYETTGKIEFVYGSMNIGEGSGIVTASIGFTTGNSANNLLSLRNISTPIVSYVPAGVNNNLISSSTPGPIAGLNSSNDGERVIFTFTPPSAPTAPTNLTFTNVADNSMTLNWADNASDEIGYIVENLNDGIITSLPANSTFYNATGLSLQTNYTWRVYAINEGASSSALEGSQTTTNSTNLPTTGNYVFAHATNGTLTDMNSGAIELIGPNIDGGASGLENIGFDFYLMGSRYNTFAVNSRGVTQLGGIPSTDGSNNLNTIFGLPKITPFWDNIGTSSTGGVRYKITGSVPNKVLTIEWFNMRIALTGSTTSDGTFQLRLYETTGKIEFIYGSMNIGEGSPLVTSSIGFTTGAAINSLLSVRNISSPVVTAVPASVNNNLVNSSTPGPIEGLSSTNDGERVIYTFTPPIPLPPSNLSITNVMAGSMTLNWTPASNIVSQAIYISTDNVQFDYLASVSSSETQYNISGLNPSTTYYWRVYSISEGGLSNPLEGSQTTNGASFTGGTKTIGATGNYTTLQSVFNDINSQGLAGAVILELLTDYNPSGETYPINAGSLTGSSESNIVILRPALGVTGVTFITDALQTFNLNQTKFFTIDGRPGGVLDRGSSSEIIISNTNASGNAILFINGASNNAIKYCNIRGVNTNEQDGVISISGEGGLSGNDNITIDNCEVRDGTSAPANLIYVGGGTLSMNDDVNITNCRLFNNRMAAIYFNSSGDNYIVSDNSIYRTLSLTNFLSFGIGYQLGIGTGNGHSIINNHIGGSEPNCGGDPFLMNNIFWGIRFEGNSSIINNNKIQNITANNLFYGIEIREGTENIISENTIGHNVSLNSIAGLGEIYGIGIYPNTSSGLGSIVTGNLIANLSSTSISALVRVIGIDRGGSAPNLVTVIENNLIHSLFANSTNITISNQSAVGGIVSNTPFKGTINGNIIYGLTSVPGGPGTANTSVIGILLLGTIEGSETNITNNRIFNLNNASAGTAPNIFGIIITGTIGNPAESGIIANNQISLDNGSSPNPMNIRGIQVNGANPEKIWNIYYNSVNIGGSVFDGALVSSAFYKQNTNTVNLRNNLFYNERTGGTGGHYAVAFENNTNVTSDYNLLVGTSNVALWGATPYNFADYKTNSGLDGFSYSTDPTTLTAANLFTDAPNGNLNINASNNAAYYVDGKGIAIEGISGDFTDGTGVRNTLVTQGTTDIGSDEFEYTGTIPDLTASGPPAPSTTTTYSFAGRELGSIMWGSGGTVPSSVSAKYFSGYNPPGILVGEYSKGYWDFTPTGGAGFTYDITLNYTPAILHNIANENNIKMAKYNSEPWEYFPDATVNTTNKTVTKTGLTSFSAFTLTSSDDPLPVELTSFTASIDRRDVYLNWSTASEINNSGFDVERKAEGTEEWSKITFIDGNGTTSETKNYTFTDRALNTGKYNYRLKQIDYNGNFEYFNLSNEVIIGVPDKYDLSQNYPNPFNPVTKINFDLPFDSKVTMKIFDITGREITTLVNDVHEAGYYTVTFDAKNIASGMYFYRIIAEGGNQSYVMTKKMAVIK